jgi:exosome complex component RRP4
MLLVESGSYCCGGSSSDHGGYYLDLDLNFVETCVSPTLPSPTKRFFKIQKSLLDVPTNEKSHRTPKRKHIMSTDFLVIPGQVIAVSETTDDEESSLLRGHGTYLENRREGGGGTALRAAIPGTVQRVNKLVSVIPVSISRPPRLQVGDLVVGRIISVVGARWTVDLGRGISCDLPLSGVHLPGSIQRIRTAADALEMRYFLREGDLVSAEVHKVVPAVQLHTRSARYGKLENGCCVQVPAALIPRLKQHYITLCRDTFQVLLGCNGWIWLQRNHSSGTDTAAAGSSNNDNSNAGAMDIAEAQEERRKVHASAKYTLEDRRDLARLRNAIICLKEVLLEITPEAIEQVYQTAQDDTTTTCEIADMLRPETIVALTASLRK